MNTTRLTRHIQAPPARVYEALVDPEAVRRWMVPDGMSSTIHSFDVREGGHFRISLTYDALTDTGKTDPQTDTFGGRFIDLIPGEKLVQLIEFETDDEALKGEMRVSYHLRHDGEGTLLEAVHEDLPAGLSSEQNEEGWGMSLDKLAGLVESEG